MLLVEISGSQVLEFNDYITTKSGIPPKLIPVFQQLATLLFKEGWRFSERGFILGDGMLSEPGDGAMIVLLPNPTWAQRQMHRVRLKRHYNGMIATDARDASQLIVDLDGELAKFVREVA